MLDQDLLKLIEGVKAERQEDFEKIKARYMPLISEMVRSFEESGSGSGDDLREEAHRALLKAALSYDTAKEGVTFGLYAKICIRNALISERRANSARQRRIDRASKKARPERRRNVSFFQTTDPDELLKTIEASLSPYEAKVLKEFFFGRSAAEVAQILGTNEKSVYNAVFRIRAKAKRLGKAQQK